MQLDLPKSTPHHLLADENLLDATKYDIEVEDKKFESSYEMAKYLVEKLEVLDQKEILYDVGLWSWLCLFYFDQLFPQGKEGARIPQEYSCILSSNHRHRARHAVRTPYLFAKTYGEKVLFMFGKGLAVRGEIVEQLSQRQNFLNYGGIIEGASILYSDYHRKTFKKGAAGKGAGGIRRFVTVLRQFDKTYDLMAMSGREIVDLLPKEFDKFKTAY
jgi:hypothetical protein